MKEEIGQILEQLKLKSLSVAKVEKALEFSNGTLGKARDGKINLPTEKMEKLRAYAKVHLEKPALDGVLIPLKDSSFTEEMAKRGVWLKQLEDFCVEKKFPSTELVPRFRGLEAEIQGLIDVIRRLREQEAQNKPDPAPQPEKRIQDTPEFKKGQEKAKNAGESKVKELSPFLKKLQESKNGQK